MLAAVMSSLDHYEQADHTSKPSAKDSKCDSQQFEPHVVIPALQDQPANPRQSEFQKSDHKLISTVHLQGIVVRLYHSLMDLKYNHNVSK